MTTNKKLIEVALPLEAINTASTREKSIRHGHPSTLHLWWARRPLAAARAVIFAQMVDDPSVYLDVLMSNTTKRRAGQSELKKRVALWNLRRAHYEEAQVNNDSSVSEPGPPPNIEECVADLERTRLFHIIEQLVLWENTTNETVLQNARDEIWQSWRRTCAMNADHPLAKELFDRHKLPGFHDPFAGGGALPLEAQRLGLESYASDLNPVAVLINKAMIEIPAKFAGRPPINSGARKQNDLFKREWCGAQGLAEDVRYYGQCMHDEAEKRIGYLYPRIEVTPEMANERPDLKPYVGSKLTVIAWLWARTVKSPNPAFASVDVPLASTFMLSTKVGREAYVEPVIEGDGYRFRVKVGRPKNADLVANGTKMSRGANFQCVMSNSPISSTYIYREAQGGRMSARLMAIVVAGQRARIYLSPIDAMEALARQAKPVWKPDVEMPENPRWFSPPLYGLKTYGDLFTARQLVALTTFSDLVHEACEQVKCDARAAQMPDDDQSLADGGTGVTAYAEAVAMYLGMSISKMADAQSSLCRWKPTMDQSIATFGRHALPMVWDYSEANVFGGTAGDPIVSLKNMMRVLDEIPARLSGYVYQADAQSQILSRGRVVSTDPPYYDNIGYADLSDFFYVWLRRSLRPIFPRLFTTMAVPKAEELVATPYRHGSRDKAERFFLDGMTMAMHRLAEQAHPAFPVTIYYAFKQSEMQRDSGAVSTGWETFLEAVIRAGFAITGTWPMLTELGNRMIGAGTNALASSVVLVCRVRLDNAPFATRGEFLASLKAELPIAVAHLQRCNIAPVDLAQASIGPGMAVYTRFAKVRDAEGKSLSVRQALALINETLYEVLEQQEGDFDSNTRWALTWFDQFGFNDGPYGTAETLSKAKNIALVELVQAGIVVMGAGRVKLLRPAMLPSDWDGAIDKALTIWEVVHHLVRTLESGGEQAAAKLIGRIGANVDIARELAYRLYTLCERKKRAAEALSYNGLVQSWPEISRLAQQSNAGVPLQTTMTDLE